MKQGGESRKSLILLIFLDFSWGFIPNR
jgi:hypothetical protein